MGNKACTLFTRTKHKEAPTDKQKKLGLNPIPQNPNDGDVQKVDEYCFNDLLRDQENGQSSNPESNTNPTFVCDFCVQPTHLENSFNIKGCVHFYCHQCIVKFVVSKLEQHVVSIMCPVPGCKGVLEPEYCRPILPKDVFDWWGNTLCENVIMGSEDDKYFYCPFKNCSALLIHDERPEDIKQSQCPHCRRVFCAKCKVPWHSEFDCVKFQKLRAKPEDKMVKELAKKKKWRRCPSCKYYVERTHGCMYMKCRCGYAFCYRCGARSSSRSHICPRCKQC